MRPMILLLCLCMLWIAPAAQSVGAINLKAGGLPVEIYEGEPVTVGIRGSSAVFFFEPDSVLIQGSSITIDLSVWGCPITCAVSYFDYSVALGQLPPGTYTLDVAIVSDGIVLDSIEFEVLETPVS